MDELINYVKGKSKSKWKMPKSTDKIRRGDPHVYLDEDHCCVWMSADGPQYMNNDKQVGSELFGTRIVRRLGIFRGLAIEKVDNP